MSKLLGTLDDRKPEYPDDDEPLYPDIDPERLATALVTATRRLAKTNWPFLKGDGWPAYSEHNAMGDITQVFLVNAIAAEIVAEYNALGQEHRRDPA